MPIVLNRAEVRSLLARLEGTPWLAAALLYGAGLRLLECLRLRVGDLDLERRIVIVRAGKGNKDRHTPLPELVVTPLRAHLERLHLLWEEDGRQPPEQLAGVHLLGRAGHQGSQRGTRVALAVGVPGQGPLA